MGAPKKAFCLRGHPRNYGKKSSCRDCGREWMQRYRLNPKNREKCLEITRAWKKTEAGKLKCRQNQKSWIASHYDEYKQKHKIASDRWREKNLDKARLLHRNIEGMRRQRKRIKFGQEGVRDFYLNCPNGLHVDHVIPLRGKHVSGLHVIWNLQYLTPKENMRKHNKFMEASNG